jgi:hypothetical protein
MVDDPLEAVYAFAERAYVRMQAGEMLLYCLEREDSAPMRTMVEELVMAGPQSLGALREVMAEVAVRKNQLQDDLRQLFSDLDGKLRPLGINLPKLYSPRSFASLNTLALFRLIGELDTKVETGQFDFLQTLHDAQQVMNGLVKNLQLLDEIEQHLRDWLWGLIYQSARQDSFIS